MKFKNGDEFFYTSDRLQRVFDWSGGFDVNNVCKITVMKSNLYSDATCCLVETLEANGITKTVMLKLYDLQNLAERATLSKNS